MRALAQVLAGAAGVLTGAALVLAGLYFFPFAHLFRSERILAQFGAGRQVEVYALEGRLEGGDDTVSITAGPGGPFAPQPPGVQPLSEPAIRDGLALITRIRDERGQVVGIATELESGHEDSNLLAGKLMTHTTWTAALPGRGGLVLYQVEDNWTLATRIIGPATLLRREFQGPWRHVNTLGPLPNGHGRVVAATGEFAGRADTFIESAEMRRLTPEGRMDFTMRLHVAFHDELQLPSLDTGELQ
jgi:hypothetical protein